MASDHVEGDTGCPAASYDACGHDCTHMLCDRDDRRTSTEQDFTSLDALETTMSNKLASTIQRQQPWASAPSTQYPTRNSKAPKPHAWASAGYAGGRVPADVNQLDVVIRLPAAVLREAGDEKSDWREDARRVAAVYARRSARAPSPLPPRSTSSFEFAPIIGACH